MIEAHFDLSRYGMEPFFEKNDIEYDAYDCIIRRELTATGKSRAFINDSPAPLSMLKELGEMLVDVHSQHQNLLINKQDFQLNVVDIIADNSALLDRYQETYALYTQKRRLLDELREEIEGNRRNADFLQFQYDELVSAGLISGEQEELEQKADTMSHSEEIKSALYDADRQLSADGTGVVSNLHSAVNAINSIIRVMPAAETLAQRMESCHIELKDISLEISSMLDDIDFDPAELDAINSRLDKIYDLEKKYRCNTVDELTELRNSLEKKLNEIENSDGTLNELEREIAEIKAECERQAATISTTRRASAAQIEREMLTRLSTLGMPNVQFRVAIDNEPLGKNGTDKASFLFCANRSGQLQPVAQVASGGEIARVMLSLKAMISGAVKLPTIIFDEIDTGVSGKIAEQMAQIMQQMGRSDRQVISITHLPQIAALGTTHYKVYKEDTTDGTISHMQMLTPDERIREIAQMLSGSDVSEAAINNAKQLLKI